MAQLLTDLTEKLVQKGIEVTVLTGKPSYIKGNHQKLPREELYQGIKIIRVYNTTLNKNTFAGRILNWISFYISVFIKSLSIPKYDCVVVLSIPPLIGIVGVILRVIKGSIFDYWMHDLYPDIAVKTGVIKEGFFSKTIDRLALFIYKKADGIIVISELMKENIVKKGVDAKKIEVIHNWADEEKLYPIDTPGNPFKDEHNLDGKFIILYSGNMGMAHDFEPIKETIISLSDKKDILFVFIGDGAKKKNLEEFVGCNKIENVKFLPYQTRESLIYSLNAGDIMLVSMTDNTKGLVVPSKLYGCLAVGKPVIGICPEDSEIGRVIKKNRCGFVVDKTNIDSKILQLYEHPDIKKEIGQNARETFMKYYTKDIAAEKFYNLINIKQGRSIESP